MMAMPAMMMLPVTAIRLVLRVSVPAVETADESMFHASDIDKDISDFKIYLNYPLPSSGLTRLEGSPLETAWSNPHWRKPN
jgi:hypothetical protein